MKKVILLCSIILSSVLLTGCIDGGNSMAGLSLGSVQRTANGIPYIQLDNMDIKISSNAFQQSNLSGVDRVITSFSVDYDKQPSGNNPYLEATLDYAAFDKSYVRDFFMTEYTSDTIPNAALVQPYITYRKDDNLLNLSYAKYEVENGIKGSVQLFRSGNYDTELNSDTLVLVYDKGDVTPETEKKGTTISEYISFILPEYPTNKEVNITLIFKAKSFNGSTSTSINKIDFLGKQETYIKIPYYRPESN
ncbi:MAG: hypothetical protein ACLSC9_11515 [Barnesiella sp.]